MKKILMSIFLLFVLILSPLGSLTSNVSANELDDIEGLQITVNDVTGIQGETIAEASFTLENLNVDPINVQIDSITTTAESDIVITNEDFTYEDFVDWEENLFVGKFDLVLNQNIEAGTYTGTITVSDDSGTSNELDEDGVQTADFTITVEAQNPSFIVESLDESGDLVISGEENTIQDNDFTLRNNGNMDLEGLMISLDGNFDDEDVEIEIYVGDENGDRLYDDGSNEVSLGDFDVAESQDITITAVIQDGVSKDMYSGQLTVYATNYLEETTTFDLLVKVEPEVCEDGRVADGEPVDGPHTGHGLRVDIDNPDKDDSFEIGEEFDVEVTVDNEADEDLDVVVEVMLYNLDENEEVETWESESIEVNEDENEDFTVTVSFPNDEDMDEDDTYILYVKAFEDRNEDDFCNYDGIEIELDRNKHDVIVDEFTMIPSVVKQGQTIQFSVDVENIGTEKEEDVYVKVINTELGLNLESNKFDLKQYDKSGNDALRTFTFEVPADAVAKDYFIEAKVYFDDADETSSAFQTLTVLESEEDSGSDDEDTGDEDTGDEDTGVTGTTTSNTFVPTGNIVRSLSGSSIFWIIGDIVLAILVIVLLVLIFRRK